MTENDTQRQAELRELVEHLLNQPDMVVARVSTEYKDVDLVTGEQVGMRTDTDST